MDTNVRILHFTHCLTPDLIGRDIPGVTKAPFLAAQAGTLIKAYRPRQKYTDQIWLFSYEVWSTNGRRRVSDSCYKSQNFYILAQSSSYPHSKAIYERTYFKRRAQCSDTYFLKIYIWKTKRYHGRSVFQFSFSN